MAEKSLISIIHINLMLAIFQYDFMLRAFAAGIIIGVLAPMIGIFLVVKRYSLLADTLSHVSLVGVALGILFQFNPIIGAVIVSSLAAFSVDRLRDNRKLFGESVLSLYLSGSLAVAIILLALSNGLNTNIFSYLFGSIATVSIYDLWLIGLLGLAMGAITTVSFKRLFIIAYDEDLAKANGLPVRLLNGLLMVMAAVTVAFSMRIVGILLVGALMVIPVLAATQFRISFVKTLLYAIVCSLISVIVGITASFYLNLPSGGTIVVVALILFTLSLLINKDS